MAILARERQQDEEQASRERDGNEIVEDQEARETKDKEALRERQGNSFGGEAASRFPWKTDTPLEPP